MTFSEFNMMYTFTFWIMLACRRRYVHTLYIKILYWNNLSKPNGRSNMPPNICTHGYVILYDFDLQVCLCYELWTCLSTFGINSSILSYIIPDYVVMIYIWDFLYQYAYWIWSVIYFLNFVRLLYGLLCS